MKIDDKTTIPLWSVFISVPAVIGAIFWISAVYYQVAHAQVEISKISDRQDKYVETIIEIKETLARIEEKIGNN